MNDQISEQAMHPEERSIKIHTAKDFDGMRKAGRLAAETLDMLVPLIKPGMTTEEINTLVHTMGKEEKYFL